jgi:hypothetical protein
MWTEEESMHFPKKILWSYFFLLIQGACLFAGGLPSVPSLVKPSFLFQNADKNEFRLEVKALSGGAELLTLFRQENPSDSQEFSSADVPLVSILRDSLGRPEPEYHRYRQTWVYGEYSPSSLQKVAAMLPFFYFHPGQSGPNKNKAPKPVLDLSHAGNKPWLQWLKTSSQRYFFDQQASWLRGSTHTYFGNSDEFRNRQIQRAFCLLSVYPSSPAMPGSPYFPPSIWQEAQARFMISKKPLGSLFREKSLPRAYNKDARQSEANRGRNWEILRQRAESEGLYFQSLTMVHGIPSHAILWIAREDLENNRERRFDGRFLNLGNPWNDDALRRWKGFMETWYLNQEGQRVSPEYPGARPLEMIPLALYGLNNPRIPSLLVDFRSSLNPKKRELSLRFINDLARNVLGITGFGNYYYMAGRQAMNFILHRMGKDLAQPSRWRSQAELKLMLETNQVLSSSLREEIKKRMGSGCANPLVTNSVTNPQLARSQYEALLVQLQHSEKFARKLNEARRKEIGIEKDNSIQQTAKGPEFASIPGTSRPASTPEQWEEMVAASRRRQYHAKLLKRAIAQSGDPAITWDGANLKESLESLFIDQHPTVQIADQKLLEKVAGKTQDLDLLELCARTLNRYQHDIQQQPGRKTGRIYLEEALVSRMEQIGNRIRQTKLSEKELAWIGEKKEDASEQPGLNPPLSVFPPAEMEEEK